MKRKTFLLEPVAPFRLDLTVWALRRRPHNSIDRWDGQTYQRLFSLPSGPVEVALRQVSSPETPQLRIIVTGETLPRRVQATITTLVERLLGTGIDLAPFYRFAARQRHLGPLARRYRGMKPPQFASVFESIVIAIACQQVTLTMGIRLLNSLAKHFGRSVTSMTETIHAFPNPEDLATLTPEQLRPLGFSRNKGRAIIELAQGIVCEKWDLERLTEQSDVEVVNYLCRLRGIGRWTAEYVLLRGLRRIHIFPGDDVGGRNNLQRWLGLTEPLDYEGVQQTLAPWHRYAGLIYLHLLLERITEAGYLNAEPQPEQVEHEK